MLDFIFILAEQNTKNITIKIDFLSLLIVLFVFRRKQVRFALKNKSALCYIIIIIETMNAVIINVNAGNAFCNPECITVM